MSTQNSTNGDGEPSGGNGGTGTPQPPVVVQPDHFMRNAILVMAAIVIVVLIFTL